MLVKKIIVGEYKVNCYVIGCEITKEACIIDPGADSSKIIEEITREKLTPKMIVLTHAHGDHIGATQEIRKHYNIPVYIHEGDKALLIDSELNFSYKIFGEKMSIVADRELKDKEIINLGNLKIEVIHVPGHTPGGISLKCDNDIFCGDTLFKASIGRTDLPGGSYNKIIDSIKKRLLIHSPTCTLYPGHGLETSIGEENKYNPFIK